MRNIHGVCLAVLAFGCGSRAQVPPTVDVRTAEGPAPASTQSAALPAPSEAERELAERLRRTVQHFAVEIGERNAAQSWNLATATDDLAASLEKLGYEVRRQGIVVGDAVVQNLSVHVSGGERGGQAIVVGAHFDTVEGTPGADENATGVAAVLELARIFYGGKPKRAIYFAFFVNAAPSFALSDKMGSLIYAKALKTEGLDVRAMLSLDGLGAFAPGPPARPYPAEVRPPYPPRSDFVALVGNEDSRSLLEQLAYSFQGCAVPVIGSVVPADVPFAAASDHAGFWKLGIPAVMLTDLAAFRYGEHQKKTDLPDKLDFDRMARIVASLKRAVGDLADGG
jgi:Peptidase family M28